MAEFEKKLYKMAKPRRSGLHIFFNDEVSFYVGILKLVARQNSKHQKCGQKF